MPDAISRMARNLVVGLARCFLWVLYGLSHLVPRREDVCVFGGGFDAFSNGKHLAHHLTTRAPALKVAWITHRRSDVRRIREAGIPAHHKWSIDGIKWTLRARWVFLNSYAFDVNFWLTGGAIRVNLWHGIPLKTLGFDIRTGPLAKVFQARGLRRLSYRFLSSAYQRPDVMICTSAETQEIFAGAFRLPASRCPPLGYPRTDLFYWSRDALEDFIRRAEPSESVAILDRITESSAVWLYAPTWRDSRRDFLTQSGVDWDTLDEVCREKNALTLVKLHPLTRVDLSRFTALRNVALLSNTLDLYPLLPFVDALITDYSSVYFDFLLLDRPIVFFPFDLGDYLRDSRDMYFAYDDVTPGPKVHTADELYDRLRSGPPSGWEGERAELRRRIWQHADGRSCARIMQFLGSMRAPLAGLLGTPFEPPRPEAAGIGDR